MSKKNNLKTYLEDKISIYRSEYEQLVKVKNTNRENNQIDIQLSFYLEIISILEEIYSTFFESSD